WPAAEPPLPAPEPISAPRPARRVPGTGAPALAARDLERRFGGVAAVEGVSLQVARGEILGLIGPNGSGTTTLLNLLSGPGRPRRGTVWLAGADISALAPLERARAGLSRGFQAPRLVPGLSLLDNVAASRIGMGAGLDPARRQAMGVLEHHGLAALAGQQPATLAPG